MLIGDEIYKKLSSSYELELDEFIAPRLHGIGLFEFIVAVMLSQNTSDVNAWKAYTALKSKLGTVTPERVLSTSLEELSESIRVAGMHRQRAQRIRELAFTFTNKNIGEVLSNLINSKRYDEAREFLLELPGVGAKTADVTLLMYYGVPTFPVDTHITRVTLRLGFVEKRDYERIRSFWLQNTSPVNYLPLHLLLITHGRRTCRPRNPLCRDCAIRNYCRYFSAEL